MPKENIIGGLPTGDANAEVVRDQKREKAPVARLRLSDLDSKKAAVIAVQHGNKDEKVLQYTIYHGTGGQLMIALQSEIEGTLRNMDEVARGDYLDPERIPLGNTFSEEWARQKKEAEENWLRAHDGIALSKEGPEILVGEPFSFKMAAGTLREFGKVKEIKIIE